MNYSVKHVAFLALAAACIAAAILLFLPDRPGDDSLPAPDPPPSPHAPEATAPAPPETAPAAWNTYHGDSALRGVAESALPDALEIWWQVTAGGPIRQNPVALDDAIYAVTANGMVLAVHRAGELLWRHDLADALPDTARSGRVRIEAPPAVFDDKLFVGCDLDMFTALDAATGQTLWRVDVGGPIRGSPNYLPGRDQVLVIEQDSGALVCIHAESGETAWRSDGVDRSDGSPAVSGDLVVFGSCASALHVAATDTGTLLRDIKIENGGGQVAGGVAIVDGYVFAGVRDGRVMRANIATGAFSWTVEISEDEVFSTPAVRDPWVIVSAYDGVVYALEMDTGAVRWRHDLAGKPSSPVIAGDTVLVAADGALFLLNLEDGARTWEMPLADDISGPAVLPGLVVVGGEDGTLTALGPVRGRDETG